MKVLLVGGTGMIGGEALTHCLSHPRITSIVAFVRRRSQEQGNSLPRIPDHPKLEIVQVNNFATIWNSDDVMQVHVADAKAMIWAMGSYNGNREADLDYPTAFLEGMDRFFEKRGRVDGSIKLQRRRFRYVHLSGKFVRQDQETRLWFLEGPRKMKGLMETRALEFEGKHPKAWETLIVKPGGVAPKRITGGGVLGMVTGLGSILGDGWSVKIDELGAFMTYLAVEGGQGHRESGTVIFNDTIAKKGRQILSEGS